MSESAVMVCQALPLPADSGGRKRSVRLAEAMERGGLHPRLLVLEAGKAGLREAARRGWTVEVVGRRPERGARLRQLLRMAPEPRNPELEKRLAELARGAALVQLEEVEMAQLIDAVPAGIPVVVSLYNVDSDLALARVRAGRTLSVAAARLRFRAARLAAAERRATRKAGATLCVSEQDREAFERMGAQNALLVPNGVDPELFDLPQSAAENGRVLFFGAHWWPPNREGLVRFVNDAWPLVSSSFEGARLRVVGPGPLGEIRSAAGSARGIEIVGAIEDLAAELAAASVVVAPIWIGGGTRIKVLEAMASARPVVGTSVGVERIGFADGRHGLVRETPEQLATAVVELLRAPQRAAQMGAAARGHVESLRWTHTTAPAEALYRRLAGSR